MASSSPDGRFTYYADYAKFKDPWNVIGRIFVDVGGVLLPAMRDERDQVNGVTDFWFGEDGLVVWVFVNNNYGRIPLIGRIDDGGQIVDVHRPWGTALETFHDDRDFDPLVADLDPTSDPFFVMSSDSPVTIETDEPLIAELESEGYWARAEPGHWYRGETLGSEPACGSSTLYKDDADGFARVLAADIELDTVVDVDASAAFTGGFDTANIDRFVVLSTECPAQYEGRRIFSGWDGLTYADGGPRIESALFVQRLVEYEVAEVLSVTVTPSEDGFGFGPSEVEIGLELLDGEILTVSWP